MEAKIISKFLSEPYRAWASVAVVISLNSFSMAHLPKKTAHAEPMSLDEAILFGFFIQQGSKANQHQALDDEGYFSIPSIAWQALPISEPQRRQALISLMIRGYIQMKRNISRDHKTYKIYVDSLLNDIQPTTAE